MLASLACRLYQEARKCDVIHANWAINGLIAGLVGKLAGRPTLTTIRGEDAARSRRSRGARLILASAIRLSSRVTAVSTDMAAWLQDEFPHARQKIRACENGIDPDFLAFEREYSRTDTPVTITTVGSLIPRKGIEVLIRALARLNDVRWIFRVVGSGPEEEALRRLVADLAIEPKVVFVGKLPPADILPELSKADIFVLGSYSEGRPNVLVEAMSTALPVVASRIEGVAELIEEGISGLTVPAGNVPAWTVVLERLLADAELRQRLGFAARQRILALGLSWETTAARYVQEYRSMVRD
jgi:glycosyltransferase involved in cell wall biosynthesis